MQRQLRPQTIPGLEQDPEVDEMVLESRKVRAAVHELVDRMRRDRVGWTRDLATLSRRARLTDIQRQRLRYP
jgi:hypothetical protein